MASEERGEGLDFFGWAEEECAMEGEEDKKADDGENWAISFARYSWGSYVLDVANGADLFCGVSVASLDGWCSREGWGFSACCSLGASTGFLVLEAPFSEERAERTLPRTANRSVACLFPRRSGPPRGSSSAGPKRAEVFEVEYPTLSLLSTRGVDEKCSRYRSQSFNRG